MVRSGFCRMWVAGSWPGAGLHLAEAEWGLSWRSSNRRVQEEPLIALTWISSDSAGVL
jgi:hypothetical protein